MAVTHPCLFSSGPGMLGSRGRPKVESRPSGGTLASQSAAVSFYLLSGGGGGKPAWDSGYHSTARRGAGRSMGILHAPGLPSSS
jgi:hypothetical protein